MLSLRTDHPAGCTMTRRSALRIGVLGGLTLPWLLRARAEAAVTTAGVRDTSVVFLTINGGPSRFETFDRIGVECGPERSPGSRIEEGQCPKTAGSS